MCTSVHTLDKKGIAVYKVGSEIELSKAHSVESPNIESFAWSPTDNILAYWVPEIGNAPCRVGLVEMRAADAVDLTVKNLFSVSACRLHWQQSGDHLCVQEDRMRSKTQVYTQFEIFRIREKGVPVEMTEIKEKVLEFAWEPVGTRFVITTGEEQHPNVAFYDVKAGKKSEGAKMLCTRGG